MNYGLLYIFLLSLAGTVYNATTRNDAWLALFAIIAVGSAFWLSWRYHETARKYERRRIVERAAGGYASQREPGGLENVREMRKRLLSIRVLLRSLRPR
jgi:hypothetical protein